MGLKRYVPKVIENKHIVPFRDAAEAWFWYVRAERARRAGGFSSGSGGNETRPCDPDDVYICVMKLHKLKKINDRHLRVLAKFGWRESPPDSRCQDEFNSLKLWDEALDRLSTILKSSGIVSVDEAHV